MENARLLYLLATADDLQEHSDRVLALSDHLRTDGIDCILDQYEDSPPEGFPRWMVRQIRATDFVLMICTPTYYRRVMGEEDPGKGHGVAWESTLIYQFIYNSGTSNARFIPILLEGGQEADIPLPVARGKVLPPEDERRLRRTLPPIDGSAIDPQTGDLASYVRCRRVNANRISSRMCQVRLYQEDTFSENSEPQLDRFQIPSLPIPETTTSNIEENAKFHEEELGTEPSLINEDNSTQGKVQTSGSIEELLTQEEQEKLISLLCELPNINYANVRHSLVSTLPARFQGNIAFHKPAKTQITEIIDVITSDASLQLPNRSYPILVLIQNALNLMKTPQLREELQLLLNNLKDRS